MPRHAKTPIIAQQARTKRDRIADGGLPYARIGRRVEVSQH